MNILPGARVFGSPADPSCFATAKVSFSDAMLAALRAADSAETGSRPGAGLSQVSEPHVEGRVALARLHAQQR